MNQLGLLSLDPPAASGAYPVRPGNVVRPLVDGIPAFRRIAEAVATARHSIWLTVTFYAPDFRFPDGGAALFDLLDAAVERGLDVRVLFWRPNPQSNGYGRTFPGTPADRDLLHSRGSRFNIRWDRAEAGFCQHQKSWILDAGRYTETAFVGGANLTHFALASPGHRDGGRHDLYVEITGPSATDVYHNFVQRWNEASERHEHDGLWGPEAAAPLAFPTHVTRTQGQSVVQIQRMVGPERYSDTHATPGGQPFEIAAGERSILEQYEMAIDAARSSIYIENQALPVPQVARRLEAALRRGVAVVLVIPGEPEAWVQAARHNPARAELFDCLEALGEYAGFLLAGLATPEHSIYVHAKAMLIDDSWATIGSCNLHAYSLGGHSEMNASIWDAGVVHALRCALLGEHLGQDTSALSDSAAMQLFRETAERNRVAAKRSEPSLEGLAIALRPAAYAK